MSYNKLALIFIILTTVTTIVSSEVIFGVHVPKQMPCSNISLNRIDQLLERLLSFGNGIKYPETEQELPQHCSNSRRLMNVLNDYLNRCGSEIQKNVGKIIVYSSKKEVKDVCRKGSKTQRNMLLMGPCINNAGRPLSRCINKVLDALVGIQNADDKIKFPLVCCVAKSTIDCVVKGLNTVRQCQSKKIKDLITDGVLRGTGPNMDLFCGQHLESDACQKLVVPKRKKGQPRPKSIIKAALDLLESIKDEVGERI